MILFTALGFAASALFSFQPGVAAGLLAGLVIANLVPARGAGCSVRFDQPDTARQDELLQDDVVRDRELHEVGEPDRRD